MYTLLWLHLCVLITAILLYSGIADAKITIVTYGLLSCKSSATVKEALLARQFKVAICDESHYFKNSRTECCKVVTPLLTAAERCLLLTGTPALARPSEVTCVEKNSTHVCACTHLQLLLLLCAYASMKAFTPVCLKCGTLIIDVCSIKFVTMLMLFLH